MKFYTRLDRPSRIYWSAAFETAPLYRRRKSARIDRSLSQTTLLWWRINATVYIYIFRFVYNRREKIRRRSGGRRITSVCVGTWSKLTSLAIRRGRNQIVCSSRLIKKWRSSKYKWRWMLGHTCRHLRANSPSSSSRSASVRRHQIGLQGPSTSHL